jgi:NAD(P)-dependent dehydrogenase (short-subunit alcohol dehydrogenase family)
VAGFATTDVADPTAIARSFDLAAEVLGPVDCLVNAAGALRIDEKPHSFEDHEWDSLVNTNFRGVRNTTREFLSRLRARGGPGVILNIASISASLAVPGCATYSATKAAVIAYTRVVAAQYGKHGVRANCISPGVVDTPIVVRDRPDYEVIMHGLAERHPLKRVGEPRDIAMLALYLCSDDAAWITGQNFIADGGFSLGAFDI